MFLRRIIFQLKKDNHSWKEYDELLLKRFDYNSYFVMHYLSMQIRKKNYQTDGTYSSIGVNISLTDQLMNHNVVAMNQFGCLHCSIIVSKEEFEQYLHEPIIRIRNEYYLEWLQRGYLYINNNKEIPVDLLLSLHDEFRKNGYKNEILFKQLCYKPLGIKVVFTKVLTTSEFHLAINAYDRNTGVMLAEGTVFRTAPDDVFYAHVIKNLQVIGDKLIILDFLNRPTFIIDIPGLCKGDVHIEYAGDMFNEEKQRKQDELIQQLIW
ncbi:MAG: hypothetical protein IJK44_08985 [Bacteroidales bacterium]|nr:hypothetical protein [Bacteroidales bacterium]